jgi:hypothetical protein
MMIATLLLFAVPSILGTPLPAPDALDPARMGKIRCIRPDTQARTCATMVRYSVHADGRFDAVVTGVVSTEPVIVMEYQTSGQIEDGAVCSTVRPVDFTSGKLTKEGAPLAPAVETSVRQRLMLALQPARRQEALLPRPPRWRRPGFRRHHRRPGARRDEPARNLGLARRRLGSGDVIGTAAVQAAAAALASSDCFEPSAPLSPSGPPPWAMSGRPPPPCPPSAATAALTRSTALTLPPARSVTPTATEARPSLTATRAATPEPIRALASSTAPRSSLGSSPSITWPIKLIPADLLRARRCGRTAAAHGQRLLRIGQFALEPAAFLDQRCHARGHFVRRRLERGSSFLQPLVAGVEPHARASPVSASMRRTPEETALSRRS